MNRLFLVALVLFLNSCGHKNQNGLIGEWQSISVKAGVLQSWFNKDSVDSINESILESSNPILESNSLLILKDDSTYMIRKIGSIEESGKWKKINDSVITISNQKIKRIYLIKHINNDSLIIELPDLEKVETKNGIGFFGLSEITLKRK